MLTIKLEQFEGPLDLLLQLIEHEKLDVTRVSLSMVTDQYFESLSHLQSNLRIDELADFLVIASKLLLIKSHCLIPTPNQEDEQEIEELEKRLRLYREFVRAGAAINQLWNRHAELYTRPRPLAAEHISFSPRINRYTCSEVYGVRETFYAITAAKTHNHFIRQPHQYWRENGAYTGTPFPAGEFLF